MAHDAAYDAADLEQAARATCRCGDDRLQQARASTVVFGELDWSPGIHHQCIGRLDREGQRCYPEPVTALYLTAEDGSDPPMMEVLGVKASQASHIIDPSLGVQQAASDDSKLQGLVERYLAPKHSPPDIAA